MSKLSTALIVLMGASLMSAPAIAGYVQPAPVTIDLENGFASGDQVTARTAKKDDSSFIGCGTRNIEDDQGGLFSWAFCQAQDADEQLITCFTFNPELVKTINAINDTSFITFNWTEDEGGTLTCNRMGFSTQSFYLGKEIKGNKVKNNNEDE